MKLELNGKTFLFAYNEPSTTRELEGKGREEKGGGRYLHEAERGDLLLNEAPAERGVGDPDAFQVQVGVRVLVQEVRDVRHVYSYLSENLGVKPTHEDIQNPAY